MRFLLRCGVGLALSVGVVGCSSQHEIASQGTPPGDQQLSNTLPEKEKEMAKTEFEKVVVRRANRSPIEGTIVHYEEFPSELIRVRPVNVWLPEGYDPASSDRYPVIYMHDGQMMFDHDTSPYVGMDVFWDVDKAITRLVRDGEIRPAIVVAIWMASWAKGARGAEYMPQKVVTDEVWQLLKEQEWGFAVEEGGQKLSADNYLKFIVHELKPFIDETYRTESDRGNTLVMGSSMGGLISAYAVAEYPGVFGGAACLSTDWRHGDGAVVRWLRNHLPSAGGHRIYFD